MKHRDLIRKLEQNGWVITQGSKHDMARHPDRPGEKIPIPRHTEINECTAMKIISAARLS